jgi:hypothetical protein
MSSFKKEEYYFSYSGLNKLLYSPILFYNHYILGEKEDRLDSYMVEGRILHCLLLEPENFDNQFIVAMDKLPSDNVKIIIDRLCKDYPDVEKLDDLETEVLSIMQNMNYLQSLKTDEQRIKKFFTDDNRNYHEFVFSSKEKTVVDSSTVNKVKQALENMIQDPEVKQVLQLEHSEFDTHIEVYNELKLAYKLDDYVFPGVKGIIDNLVINHADKTAIINDVKTTGKSLLDFKDTVEYYNYWMQMGIYTMLVEEYLKEKQLDYEIQHNFVVIDKYNQHYIFPVGIITFTEWYNKTKLALKVANYHLSNDDYSLPYELIKEKMYL